ncbi:MAG: hypothetical protein ACUVX8_07415 [Candidatus Zipacnadales bacterium]
MNNMTLTLMEGAILGLSTGASCLGWCLPALGPYVATQALNGREGLRAVNGVSGSDDGLGAPGCGGI